MESDDRRHLDVSPTLKAKLLELLESKKLPLEELAQALYIHDTSPYATVADLVNQYESRNQALTLEKWKFIFKKLHLSKELEDLLAVDQSVMMINPTAVGEVNCSGSLPAEKSLQGTQPSQDLVEPRGVPLQDKLFLCVNDPSLKLPVVNPRAREGAIPKTKQPQPPPSTVKPDVGEKMLIGAPGSQSDLNLPSIPGGDFGDKCPQSWSLHSPESIESAEWNAADCSILCDSSVQNESQDTGFFSGEGNSCTQTTSSSSTALLYTPATGNEEYQDQNGASTVIPEPGKAKHGIQLLPSLSEDSQMQPGRSRTPAILTTPERAQSKHSPSTPDSSLTNIENDLRAREYQGAIPKRNWYQPSHSTVTHDVRQDSESNLNLPSIQAGDFTGNCPQSSSPPPELMEIAARNSAGCEIFCDSLLRNENQDTESSSEEGNSLSQMTSLSTTRMDAPASGHEGIQHQNSASATIPEGGKTKHQITKRQLDHCKITPARPNTPEGAQPGRNSLSLVTGRHNNRPNQTGEEDDRAVEHYDATENNGLLEETKQELESSQKSVLYLAKKLREKESFCQTLRADLVQSRQTLEESRQQCVNLRISKDNLQAENEELRRSLEELQHLSYRILEDNRRFGLLLARQAGDVAFEGSSAAVGEGNVSDCSEVEPEADEQPGPFPYLQESDSEDSSDDEFFDALDY